jgi:hypothetical protein
MDDRMLGKYFSSCPPGSLLFIEDMYVKLVLKPSRILMRK